jgi:hypothetical protein
MTIPDTVRHESVRQDWDLLSVEETRFKTAEGNDYNTQDYREWKIMKFIKHVSKPTEA